MYKNVMEVILEQKLSVLWKDYKGCKCTRCHDDIMTYALNRLPTQYVSTPKGELFNKAASLSLSHDVDVIKILAKAMQVVEQQPRHSLKENVNGSYDVFVETDEN